MSSDEETNREDIDSLLNDRRALLSTLVIVKDLTRVMHSTARRKDVKKHIWNVFGGILTAALQPNSTSIKSAVTTLQQ